MPLDISAARPDPALLDLPWSVPLEDWPAERLAALPRMVAAVRSGRYRGVGMGRLGLIAAGVAYVVSPVDVVPEGLLLVAGLVLCQLHLTVGLKRAHAVAVLGTNYRMSTLVTAAILVFVPKEAFTDRTDAEAVAAPIV